MTERYLSVNEVADVFRVSPYTVRTWLKDKDHPLNGIKPARDWRVSEQAVREHAERLYGEQNAR